VFRSRKAALEKLWSHAPPSVAPMWPRRSLQFW